MKEKGRSKRDSKASDKNNQYFGKREIVA
jgi:hypothetical protein